MSEPYRFRDAVRAIGTTEAAVRQWLNSGKVKIERGYGEGWATFTLRDIAVLAVTEKLAEFAVPISEAFRIAGYVIDLGRKDVRGKRFARPGQEFAAGWEGFSATVRRDPKNPKAWHVARWKHADVAFGNYVNIDIGNVVNEAFDRLEAWRVEPAVPGKKVKSG